MSVADKLIQRVFSSRLVSYLSDNVTRKTLDGKRDLVPYLAVTDQQGKVATLGINDVGFDSTTLEIFELDQGEIPKNLSSVVFYENSNSFDGPIYQVFYAYDVDGCVQKGFSHLSFFDGEKEYRLGISEEAPTLFEISVK